MLNFVERKPPVDLPQENKIYKTSGGFLRMLEILTEMMAWLRIVASPLLIGMAIGLVIYFSRPTTARLIAGIGVATIGLVIGMWWAEKQRKGKGTAWFMSRISAKPELEHLEKETHLHTPPGKEQD